VSKQHLNSKNYEEHPFEGASQNAPVQKHPNNYLIQSTTRSVSEEKESHVYRTAFLLKYRIKLSHCVYVDNIAEVGAPFAGSAPCGFFMGWALRKILKWLIIKAGVILGVIFIAMQWMQKNG
jgi:hypothetical protein